MAPCQSLLLPLLSYVFFLHAAAVPAGAPPQPYISSTSSLVVPATVDGTTTSVTFTPCRVTNTALQTVTAVTTLSPSQVVYPGGWEWKPAALPEGVQAPPIPANAPYPIPKPVGYYTEPTETTSQVNPTETTSQVDPTETTSQVDPTETTSQVDPTETTSQVDPTETTSQVDPTETTSQVDPTETTSQVDPTETTSQVDPTETTSQVDPTETTSQVDPTETTSQVDPTETTSQVDPTETTSQVDEGSECTPTTVTVYVPNPTATIEDGADNEDGETTYGTATSIAEEEPTETVDSGYVAADEHFCAPTQEDPAPAPSTKVKRASPGKPQSHEPEDDDEESEGDDKESEGDDEESEGDEEDVPVCEEIAKREISTELMPRMEGSSALSEEWQDAPRNVYASGLYGCTSIAIVSQAGVWLSRHWEEPSFRGSDDKFRTDVITALEQGSGEEMPSPSSLTGADQILRLDQQPQILIMTPMKPGMPKGEEVLLYEPRIQEIITSLNGAGKPFEGVEVITRGYVKRTKAQVAADKEKDCAAHGQVLVQFKPGSNAVPEGYPPATPPTSTQSSWHVSFDGKEFAEHSWDAAVAPEVFPTTTQSINQPTSTVTQPQPSESSDEEST